MKEVALVKSVSKANAHLRPGNVVLNIDPRYFRPTEVDLLMGDPTKAMEKLGWKPKYALDAMIEEMVEEDIRLFQKDKYLEQGGHRILSQAE